MWVDLTQAIEGLKRRKKLSKGEGTLPACLLKLGHQPSPALRLELTASALLVLRPLVRLELHCGLFSL